MSSSSRYSTLIDTLFQSANEHLIGQFSQLLEKAPAHLDALADSQTEYSHKQAYFDLRFFITSNNDELRQGFFVALNKLFSVTPIAHDEQDEELSLVSQEEMEEMVAITTLHAHAINRYGEQLDHLEARLEYLEISDAYSLRKDCLNPDKIGDALKQALADFTIEADQKLEFYSLFEALLISGLEPMYRELNALLIDAGILPEIVLRTNRHIVEEQEDIVVTPHRTQNTQHRTAEHALSRHSSNLHNIASKILDKNFIADASAVHLPESFRRPVAKQGDDGQQYYDRKDVLKALQKLQQQITEGGTAQDCDFDSIKRHLMTDMANSEGSSARKCVSTLDERNIDFVGMLFSELTHDQNIPVLIKNLLLQLQIPMIRLAMISNALYEKSDHPARELLDLIPAAGRGIDDPGDNIYRNLVKIVEDVLRTDDCDTSCFEEANDKLKQLIETENRIARQNEKRAQRAVVYTNARQVIVDEMRHITSQKHIPGKVTPLITRSWPTLMINRYVKHGSSSWEWLESVMLMKLLIKCLQPIHDDRQWQTVWNNHLALVDAVHEELSTTKQDPAIIEQHVSRLKQTFLELLDAYGFRLQTTVATSSMNDAANDDVAEPQCDMDEDIRHTNIADVARSAKTKLEQLPDHVHPGIWYEIFNGEDKAVRRLKLSVVLTEVARLVFVDHKGVKVMEKDAEDFADELQQQRSRQIADHSTFDQALCNVISALAA